MILRALIAWLLLVPACFAQVPQTGAGTGVATSYLGPADVVASPSVFWGLRAVSAAFALTQGEIIKVIANSNTCFFDVATNGGFGLADGTCASGAGDTIFQWALHGTASCTIASPTLTCTGATATPIANDTLSGTGITIPVLISSCGAFAGGAGTCTLGTTWGTPPAIGVAETITFTYQIIVNTLVDQTGNTNLVQQTNGPSLFPVCLGTIPCIAWNTPQQGLVGTIAAGINQPLTASTVSEQLNSSGGAFYNVLSAPSSGSGILVNYGTGANGSMMFAGTVTNKAAAIGAMHTIQQVYQTTTSIHNVDGSSSTVSPGAQNIAASSSWQLAGGPNNTLVGLIEEAGVWPVSFSPTNVTAMHNNQCAYYGTAC